MNIYFYIYIIYGCIFIHLYLFIDIFIYKEHIFIHIFNPHPRICFFIDFEERVRERKKHRCERQERETLTNCLPYTPGQGSYLQPRNVP